MYYYLVVILVAGIIKPTFSSTCKVSEIFVLTGAAFEPGTKLDQIKFNLEGNCSQVYPSTTHRTMRFDMLLCSTSVGVKSSLDSILKEIKVIDSSEYWGDSNGVHVRLLFKLPALVSTFGARTNKFGLEIKWAEEHQPDSEEGRENPIHLSFPRLLGSPEIYHNKLVALKGYLAVEFEESILYFDKESRSKHIFQNGLFVSGEYLRLKKMSKKWVYIEGRFNMLTWNSRTPHSGSLFDVKVVEKLR